LAVFGVQAKKQIPSAMKPRFGMTRLTDEAALRNDGAKSLCLISLIVRYDRRNAGRRDKLSTVRLHRNIDAPSRGIAGGDE
jgi:hypothetical protein